MSFTPVTISPPPTDEHEAGFDTVEDPLNELTNFPLFSSETISTTAQGIQMFSGKRCLPKFDLKETRKLKKARYQDLMNQTQRVIKEIEGKLTSLQYKEVQLRNALADIQHMTKELREHLTQEMTDEEDDEEDEEEERNTTSSST